MLPETTADGSELTAKMPTRRFTDAHVHLWDRSHAWFTTADQEQANDFGMGDISGMAGDYSAEDYRRDSEPHARVDKFVWVTATLRSVGHLPEVEYAQRLSAGVPGLAAIIGSVDPALPTAERLDTFERQARCALFRGIRVLGGLDYSSRLAEEYMRMLADAGCVYDLVAHHEVMEAAARVAERHPDVPWVLEHCGWPRHPEDLRKQSAWRQGIASLARIETVTCKLSGLAMSTHTFALDAQRPFLEHCIESFGVDRCMFASNFPVDRLYGNFGQQFSLYEAVTEPLGLEAQGKLFATNAERFYSIDATPATQP